jgi:hypothetical protein
MQIRETEEFSGIFEDKEFIPSYELLNSVQELRRAPAQADERILDSVSFAFKNYDFSNIPVHLEAKSVRTLPRQSTFFYKDRAVGSHKSRFKSLFVFVGLIALILIVIYVFLT